MSDEEEAMLKHAMEASEKAMRVLMLLISDAPFSQVVQALEEFKEASEREVS